MWTEAQYSNDQYDFTRFYALARLKTFYIKMNDEMIHEKLFI